MLIAMAGLPGTGKSTLAARLATTLGGVVLSKDVVRSALFPLPALDYSAAQDDLAMEAIYSAASLIFAKNPSFAVILDGRTFSRRRQIDRLTTAAEEMGQPLAVIECIASDDVIRERLDRDFAAGTHPAGNRTFEMYLTVKNSAEPLTIPRLTLDTGTLTSDVALDRCRAYLVP